MARRVPKPAVLDLSRVNWMAIGNVVCEALTVSLKNRDSLVRSMPEAPGFESLAAASITQMLNEHLVNEAARQAAERG